MKLQYKCNTVLCYYSTP